MDDTPAPIVSNTWLSDITLRIVVRAVRFPAIGSATLGINPCLAHCQFQESIVLRVSLVLHVPLAAYKSRSAPNKPPYQMSEFLQLPLHCCIAVTSPRSGIPDRKGRMRQARRWRCIRSRPERILRRRTRCCEAPASAQGSSSPCVPPPAEGNRR